MRAKQSFQVRILGQSVYNHPHIGNWRAFIFADLIRRYLKYRGYELKHVMNITDVDDKTIRDSQNQRVTLKEFTEKYTKIFFEERDLLNIERVEDYPKATESIQDMLEIVKKLVEKGFAYKSEDGSVYYNISKFKDYGKLSKIDFKQLKAGARVKQDEYEKESASDFALWKGYEESDGEVFWDTEFGKGRPGWHIECSAMSTKRLGQPFDIHTGGIDLIFPHHENEIAQSEGAYGKKFVDYWMHNEHLLVNGEKMSKSKGNFFILPDIITKGVTPGAIRYLLLSTHYRQKLNFTFDGLKGAEKIIQRFEEFISKLKLVQNREDNPKVREIIEDAQSKFELAMDDDLNISGGLASIFEFMRAINKLMADNNLSRTNALEVYNLIMEFNKILGIIEFKQEKIPREISELVKKREQARKNKDWDKADQIRDQIKGLGFKVEDTTKGPRIKKLKL